MDDFRQAERSLEMHSRISKLQESLGATSQENDQIQKQYQRDVKRLRRNIKDLEQELRESKDGSNITEQKSLAMKFDIEHVFRPKIIHLEQKLKESQDRNNISEGRLSAMRTKLEKLQAQTMSDWLARNRLEIGSK
jgi:septal ring factor EnvC (AmiA/AmiB activator)